MFEISANLRHPIKAMVKLKVNRHDIVYVDHVCKGILTKVRIVIKACFLGSFLRIPNQSSESETE